MDVDDVKRVGVVGSGVMGHGIAFAFALGGYPTLMSDLSEQALLNAMKGIRTTADLFAEEGLVSQERVDEAVGRVTTTTDLAELASGSDFVTEAIVERSKDKRELFSDLDRLCPSHTIIASNTSSLVLSEFGADVRRQDKIAVTHYFAPPAIVPGVEVARGPGTSDETHRITFDLMKRINHMPIAVLKERPGYLLNRIQGAMSREAYRLWAEGVATAEDIELGIKSTFGFRMHHEGPMLHYDLAGIWKWPADVRARLFEGVAGGDTEAAERVRQRAALDSPWFIATEEFEQATALRDRDYVRRLKELYWPEEDR